MRSVSLSSVFLLSSLRRTSLLLEPALPMPPRSRTSSGARKGEETSMLIPVDHCFYTPLFAAGLWVHSRFRFPFFSRRAGGFLSFPLHRAFDGATHGGIR